MNAAQASENLLKDVFQLGAKKIKGKHIKDQVHVIAMNEPGRYQTKVLTLFDNQVRVHHKATEHLWFLHSIKAEGRGDNDNTKRECNFHYAKYEIPEVEPLIQ